MKKPPILSRYPRSEPDRATWSFPHQIKLTFGRRSRRLHQYPACGGWGSRGRGHSSKRWLRNFEQGVKWKLGLTAGMFCLRIGELVLENDFLERALGKAGFPSAKR